MTARVENRVDLKPRGTYGRRFAIFRSDGTIDLFEEADQGIVRNSRHLVLTMEDLNDLVEAFAEEDKP